MKKNLKKVMAVMMCLAMVFVYAACSNGDSGEGNDAASGYPSKSIRIVVPFAAGGGADISAREYADAIVQNKLLSQPVIVENITGGGGVVGTTEVVNSAPDGYNFLFAMQGAVTVQTQMGNTSYDYTDLKPVVCVKNDPVALVVSKDCKANTIDELIALAKEKESSGGLKMSFAGPGTTGHLAGMSFVNETGIPMTEVQYDGTATAMAALLGGHVDTYVSTYGDIKRFLDSGEAKIIFATAKNKYMTDDVQVLSEAGIDCVTTGYTCIYAPKDTPDEICEIFRGALLEAQKDQKILDAADRDSSEIVGIYGDDLAKMIENDYNATGKTLESIGLKK